MINTTDIYKEFVKRNPATDVNYQTFKYILTAYNKGIVDALMAGETFNLGTKLGRLSIKKFPRNFNRKSVDWGETNKLLKQGIRKLVFFTDDFYFAFNWEKRYCTIKNKSVYKFYPAGGKIGPRKRLIQFLKSNDMNKLNFKE